MESHNRFPAGFVFSLPEFHGFVVADDVAVFGAAGQVATCSVGDVAQVAEQRALVAGENFLVQVERFVVADRGDEVFDVLDVSLVAIHFFLHLVGGAGVEGAVASAVDRHGSVFAVEGDEIVAVPVAAHAVPGHRLLAFEFERDVVSVRRLLVIVEAVTTAG